MSDAPDLAPTSPREPPTPADAGSLPAPTPPPLGFVADGTPYEPPLSAAAAGYAQTPPAGGLLEAAGAMAAPFSRAVVGAFERGSQPDASAMDRALYGIGRAAQLEMGDASEPADDPATAQRSEILTPDEANKRFAPEGESITDKPISAGLAEIIGRQKTEEMRRDSIIGRWENQQSWPVNFAVGTVTQMLDPLAIGSLFLPGIGEEATLGALGRAGFTGFGARTVARGVAGATMFEAQTAPLVALQYGLGQEQASDFGFRDAMTELAYSAAFGAAQHAGFGALREAWRLRPDYLRATGRVEPESPPAPRAPPLPDTALTGAPADALTRAFTAEDYTGEPVDLSEHGFPPDVIATLHRDGLVDAEGRMSPEQFEAWREERAVREAPPAEPEVPTPVEVPEEQRTEQEAVQSASASERHAAMEAAIAQTVEEKPIDIQAVIQAGAADKGAEPQITPSDVAARERDLAATPHATGLPDGEVKAAVETIYPEERPAEIAEEARPKPEAATEEKPAPRETPPLAPVIAEARPAPEERPPEITIEAATVEYEGKPWPVKNLQNQIDAQNARAIGATRAAQRARTATDKAAQREAHDRYRASARAAQAVLDRWKAEHPDEAARIFGDTEPAAPPPPPAPTLGMSLVETIHTRDKYPLFAITLPAERLPRDRFEALKAAAKEGGGRWSSYRGQGAVPGFLFKDRAAAETFLRKYGGEPAAPEVTTPVTPPVTPRPARQPTRPEWTEIGKNQIGQTLYEDQRGIRSYIENGVRHTEPVGIIPGGGFRTDRITHPEYEIVTPRPPEVTTPAPEVTPRPAAPIRPASYGANNRLVTTAEADAIRARLRAKAAQLRTGIDPEMMIDGTKLAVFHIEAGTRAFVDFAREMIADLGEEFRPYLRSWYEAARHWPGVDTTGMSSGTAIEAEQARTLHEQPQLPLDRGEADRLLDAHEGEPEIENIAQRLANGEDAYQIAQGQDRFTVAEIEGLADALDRRGEIPEPSIAPEEAGGIQGALPLRYEGERAEDVQPTAAVGPDGRPLAGEVGGGPRVAPPTPPEQPAPVAAGGAGGGGAGVGAPAGVPGTAEGPAPRTTRRPTPDALVKGQNYVIEPGALQQERGRVTKARGNLDAIALAKQLIDEGRPATKAEQEVLALYTGWGGLSGVFEETGNLAAIGARLKELLTPEEYETARRSTQYAHYTAEHVVRSMWQAVENMGFKGGAVFEPGMGIGHFLGMIPADLAANTRYQGIEMDGITASIAKLLYPESGIRQADMTKTPIPEAHFDLSIGNPPFSDVVIRADPKYAARGFMLHDYFFAKSLDSVRPGGLLAFVTSAGTMNKLDSAAREYMAERAEFLGGVRLNNTAFRQTAGTEVTTDILFFQRRPEGRVELSEYPAWTQTVQRTLPDREGNPFTGNVSRYFSEHPEMVLGEEGFFDQLVAGPRYAVRALPGRDLEADLRAAIERLPKDIMREAPTPEERAELDFTSGQKKDGSFYMSPDGRLMQYRDGAGQEVPSRGKGQTGGFTAAERQRIERLIPIRDALRDVFAADLKRDEAAGAAARALLNEHYDRFVQTFGPINKAEFQYRRPTLIQQESERLERREEARSLGEYWDDGDFDPEPMLRANAKITEIARARDEARQAALRAGKTFNEGTFDPAEMPDITFERRPNIRPFMGDPESYRLRSIERYDDATGTSSKRPIFTENILAREPEARLASANDGVLWSLNQFGRLDLDAIAAKMGRDRGDLVNELGDAVYKIPGTLDTYQTREEYLSGDVVSKLEEARAAAEHDPEVRRNVDALEAAVPAPLPPSEISMVLGMPWIPREIVQAFAAEHMNIGQVRVVHSPGIGTWTVIEPMDTSHPGVAEWGTPDRDAYRLLSDALNRTPPRIFRTFREGGETKTEFDAVATQAAQDKVDAIKQAFSDWVHADPQRADGLAGLYNDALNRTVLRQYDGSYLTTPGVAADWSWRPHQTRVVARIVQSGNTYMAHAVGAGKTSAMIGAGMEMRRLGLVKKPMYVVPNHMLGQFTKEFYEQYPTARIAVADEDRFHTSRRRQFVANVSQDDLDAIIITHSGFGKIAISDEFQKHLIQEQLDMLSEALENLKEQGGERFTISRLENQREKLVQKLSRPTSATQDQTLNFEEMGADFLFVDEAHLFRKLSFSSRQSNLKGIDPAGSNMAWDLYSKIRYLDSQTPGRSVVFASGTPITNTMGELYSLSRYMQPEALAQRGLSHFDSWAQAFGDTKTQLEENAAGSYQPVTRFSQFVNLPELYKMVGEVMDIVTPNQLEQYVTRPQIAGGRQFHLAPRTPILDAYQADLGRRMEAIKQRKGPPKKGDDILLSVINDGRHAAIDPRFVAETANDPRSKLNEMIANVARIWRETTDHQFYDPATGYEKEIGRGPATQMIFANLGVNGRGPMGFSSYQWIKEALRREGIPASEIAFIGDYEGTVQRQALFNDMNEGKVRILVGSTQKMGTGVNAQKRLFALHNLDPLWYPADDEQRVGRILRQGNLNKEIQVHDYSTKGTYDSAMWRMMGNKARFIEQFFRGDPELRTMEDLGEASMYEQASAMSTTDERMIRLTELRQELDKARRRESAYERDQYSMRTRLKSAESTAAYLEGRSAAIQQDITKRVDTRGEAFKMNVAGTVFDKRPEAAAALDAAINDRTAGLARNASAPLGEIGGFPLQVQRTGLDYLQYSLRMSDGSSMKLGGTGGAGIIASAENRLRSLENDLAYAERQREAALKEAANIRPQIGRPNERAGETVRIATELRDLEAQLKGESEAARQAEAGAAARPRAEGERPDPEMEEAERQLAGAGERLAPEDRDEIAAADRGIDEAENQAAAIEEAANCLKGTE